MRGPCGMLLMLGFGAAAPLCAGTARRPLNSWQAQSLARKYLVEKDSAKKAALLAQAGDTPVRDPAPFLRLLIPRGFAPQKKGIQHGLTLKVPPEVSAKPVEYSLAVPGNYAPNKLWPLIIGLHGGGNNSGSGRQFMRGSRGFAQVGAIFACPTSVDLGVMKYWRNPKNERMLALLIRHLSSQFPIDPNRIYLCGYSMGGIGCYYLGARMTDRFAAVAPGGGSWHAIYWPVMLNTPVYIWHGKRDMRGKRFTNFPNARNAAAILKELGYAHELHAMDCGHGNVPPDAERKAGAWLLKQKRDPYPKRIVTSSPRAKDFSGLLLPAPPDRWLAIDEIGPGKLDMDALGPGGTPRKKVKIKMGIMDATWSGPNTLSVKARNVKRFRVFLSPKLMKADKPLRIMVNGKVTYEGTVKTSLKFLMKYLDERRDLGMAFIGEVAVNVKR